MKRWYFNLLLFALTVVVFFGSFVSADEIPPWACSEDSADDSQELFSISSGSNAHVEVWDQNNYGTSDDNGREICYWRYFWGSWGDGTVDPHQDTGENTVLRISGLTNAHAENLSFTTAGYFNVTYGDLVCFLADADKNCNVAPGDENYSLIVSLYSPTNTHVSLEDDDERYAVCCKSPGREPICDYDGECEEGQGESSFNCPDCETYCGDGKIQGLEECDCGNDGLPFDPENPSLNWGCGDGNGDDLNDTMCVDLGGYVSGTPSCFMPGEDDACTFDEEPCVEAECADDDDNDNDGATDEEDFSCWDADGNYNASDNNETLPIPQCNDGIDNDGDGFCDAVNDVACVDLDGNPLPVPVEADPGCIDLQGDPDKQHNLEANCGDGVVSSNEDCDFDTNGDELLGGADCKSEDFLRGDLSCKTDGSCLFNYSECVGFQGFCIDNVPFEFWQGEIMVSPSSCQDYNLVYPGDENKSMRKELCVNDCVAGASDPVNNGHSGDSLIDWGCAWDDTEEECIFVYNTSVGGDSSQQCRLDYEIKRDCSPSNPFRLVEVTGDEWPNTGEWACECEAPDTCTKEIACPNVIQLPFIGSFGLAMVVLIVTIVYIYINRKK